MAHRVKTVQAGWLVLLVGTAALVAAAIASPPDLRAAADQLWPPFVLVAGLLMVGLVAHSDGLFEPLAPGLHDCVPIPPSCWLRCWASWPS